MTWRYRSVAFATMLTAAMSLLACSRTPVEDVAAAAEDADDDEQEDEGRQEGDRERGDDRANERGFWTDDEQAIERAEELLAEMSLDQKVNMLHGELNPAYAFYNGPIEDVGIPALTMANGPAGVAVSNPDVNERQATMLPTGIALGATWDPELARRHGDLMGAEAHLTSHNVMLTPVVDVVRVPQFGRVFETFGEDPLLSGMLGAANIRGIQSHPVISSLKHYVVYTQEENRLEEGNVVIGERALQEIYVRPFAIANRDGRPGSMMCSFNKINGVYACENEYVLDDVLKGQLDFAGWVMSDFGSAHSTVPTILAGMDQEMPGNFMPEVGPGDCLFCGPLLEAVERGAVPMRRIDDAVTRILRPMFALGLFDVPPVVEPLPEEEHGAEARAIAEQAIVLLKNDGGALPLGGDISSIAVIGADADVVVTPGGSALVRPTYSVSPLDGIRARAGQAVSVEHAPGTDPVTSVAFLPGPQPIPSGFFTPPGGEGQGMRSEYFLNPEFSGEPELDRVEPYAAINGGFFIYEGLNAASPHFPEQPQSLNTDISVRWTGRLTAPMTGMYELSLTTTGTSRLYVDDELVASTEEREMTTTTAPLELDEGSVHDVRVEFVAGELTGTDVGPQFKLGWNPPEGVVSPEIQEASELARRSDVAVVVVRDYAGEGGDRPDLGLPVGQGDLIREVAAANPRTIVVMTVGGAVRTANWDEEVGALVHAWYGGQEQGNAIARVLFGDVNPSGRLPITLPVDEGQTPVSTVEQYPGVDLDAQYSEGIFVGYRGYEANDITPRYAFGFGLSYTTYEYDDLRIEEAADDESGAPFRVTVTVRNSGEVEGTETVQVYVGALPAPVETAPKALAGFAKVTLAPGQSEQVTIPLNRESLSYWDVEAERWVLPSGDFPILAGASSADIRLTGIATRRDE